MVLWWRSTGSNDIGSWHDFGKTIASSGLGSMYVINSQFNHPPPMGQLAALTWWISDKLALPFPQLFKLWGLAGEIGTIFLLYSIWSRRGDRERAALACAAYGCGLVGILISGFHGNYDPLLWCFLLASCYWLEGRQAPFRAGLFLGAALDVKLIAVLVALPLAATCRSLRDFRNFCTGAAVALIPFGMPLLWFKANERAAFVANVFGYLSSVEDWGIELILRQFIHVFHVTVPPIGTFAQEFAVHYHNNGARYLVAATTLLALWQVLRRPHKLDAYSIVALSLCLFLVFASGFGVQYLGCVVPVLLAFDIGAGFAVATATGVFATAIYCSFVVSWDPIATSHSRIDGGYLGPVAFLAWWVLAGCALQIWRERAIAR